MDYRVNLDFTYDAHSKLFCRAPKIPINAIYGIVIFVLSVEDANPFARCGWADSAF